jgi:hypothetical protein
MSFTLTESHRLCLFRVLMPPFFFIQYSALHTCCNCSLFLFSVQVGWCPSPTLLWSMPHDSHCYKLSPLQGCCSGSAAPAFSGQLVYLQFAWGSAPLPLSRAQGALPSLLHVFFFFSCLFIIQFGFFLFFPWAEVSLSRKLCWFVPGFSMGVLCAAYLLTWGSAKQVRSWHLVAQELS